MITRRQSFLVSFGAHVTLVIVLVIVSILFAKRVIRPRPFQVELQPRVQASSETNQGAQQEQPDEPKPEPQPKIIERTIEAPSFSRNASLNLDNIPNIAHEQYTPYKPTITATGDSAGSASQAAYIDLIVAECQRNWEKTKPARGELGQTIPTLEVVITVRRDGGILGHRITRSSGNAALDRSVRQAIDRSDPLPAFTPDMSGTQQDFELRFVLDE